MLPPIDLRQRRWHEDDDLHRSIIPWLAEWLVCYELYQFTEKWHGPEAPHGSDPKAPQPKPAS